MIAAEQWWKLRNEAEARKQGVDMRGSFHAKSGWLHNVIVSKHAAAMESFPEPIILPREPGDREQARMLTAVLPVIMEQNYFEDTYSNVTWQKLKTGTGVYKVIWDADKHNGLGDIDITRVDLLSLFWEPGITDIQKSRYLFHCELQDNELLEETYPQLKDKLNGVSRSLNRFLYDDTVSTEGKSLVIDVYYKRNEDGRTVLHYCKYVGDTVLYDTSAEGGMRNGGNAELEERSPLARHSEPVTDVTGVGIRDSRRPGEISEPFSASGGRIATPVSALARNDGEGERIAPKGTRPQAAVAAASLRTGLAMTGETEDNANSAFRTPNSAFRTAPAGLYDHGLYPFVFDPLWPVEGSPCGYGYVDLCRNTQAQIDMLDTAFLRNAVVGATPRYFERMDGSINEEEFKDLTSPVVHVAGTLDDTGIRVIDYKPLAGGYLNFYRSKISELRETSGNTESANGIYSGAVTAASAIASLQEASGKTSRDASRASYRAFAELTEMIIELVRQFYDLPRTFRIVGQDGGEDFVLLDNSAIRPQPLGVGSVMLGYRLPVFDIRVEVQKRNAYTRQSQNELAMQLYNLGFFNPQCAVPALSCLEMMDFEGKEELMGRLRRGGALSERLMQTQRLALALLEKYEPENAAVFRESAGDASLAGDGRPLRFGGVESGVTAKARARTGRAAEA